MQRIKVAVPATSANLGPGFDSLGIALTLYADVTFELLEDEGLIIEGCPDEYKNENNLVYTAFRGLYWRLGKRAPGVKIVIDSKIPPTRGLGSSSAMLTAGVMAANHFAGEPYSKEQLLQILTEFEGHPDNVTPCLYGGLTATAVQGEKPYMAMFPVNDKVKFCAMIPSFELSTSASRMAIPTVINHKDAVFNVSRIALLLKAFETADAELFAVALNDRLHQPYREHLIDDYKTVRLDSIASGACGLYLSGAGPTVIAVYFEDEVPARIQKLLSEIRNEWIVMPLAIDKTGATVAEA